MKASGASKYNLAQLQQDVDQRPHAHAIRGLVHQYSTWQRTQGFDHCFPINKEQVCKFLVHKVNFLQGSSKSLRRWFGYLRSYSISHRLAWVDQADENSILDLISRLEFLDIHPTTRAVPMVQEVVGRILACPDISDILKCVIALAHDGLLRGGEVCSDLKVSDFEWSASRQDVRIFLERTKTHRSGGSISVLLIDYGPSSGVHLLRNHFATYALWNKQDQFVIPFFNRKLINWSASLSVDQFRYRIKQAVALIGLNPRGYGTHSLRAGGATDLFRAAVPYPIIKKFGRWKSDTALLYFRCDEFVALSACKGFARVIRGRTKEGMLEYLI